MNLHITQMTTNRAYSKARRRLAPKLDELKRDFASFHLHDEAFDLVLVSFVDAAPDLYREIPNEDRVYQVEMTLPTMKSYSSEEDSELLLKIAGQLRKVLEQLPIKEVNRAELLKRFSDWESSVRKGALRIVKSDS